MSINENRKDQVRELKQIPGVGVSIANDLINIGITRIDNLKSKDPEWLYHQSNKYAGAVQDRCLLYVFRCAVYFATESHPDNEKLKWWNWKDK
jgi:hypothetical protein